MLYLYFWEKVGKIVFDDWLAVVVPPKCEEW
jgi:hypothetical protein